MSYLDINVVLAMARSDAYTFPLRRKTNTSNMPNTYPKTSRVAEENKYKNQAGWETITYFMWLRFPLYAVLHREGLVLVGQPTTAFH